MEIEQDNILGSDSKIYTNRTYLNKNNEYQDSIYLSDSDQVQYSSLILEDTPFEIFVQKQNEDDQKNKQLVVKQNINQSISPNHRVKLWTGVTLTSEGVLRLCSTLSSISFNYQQQIVDRVEHKRNLGVVDLHFSKDESLIECPIDKAIHFISHMPHIQLDQIENILKSFSSMLIKMKKSIQEEALSVEDFEQKNQEFQDYVKKCYQYLQNHYINANQYQMYWYSIGRINLEDKDIEVKHTGFSKPYLELLGLNEQSLNSLYLRKQQIDLIKDQFQITNKSIQGLQSKQKMLSEEFSTFNIVTFDGFPLKLNQRKINISQPDFKKNKKWVKDEYFFSLIEMDVDLDDLQKLIQYRQRIIDNKKDTSLEEYLQKELSYFFEDVEYSINSQTFLEKYYKENLEQINYMQNTLQQKNKQCGFKYIKSA